MEQRAPPSLRLIQYRSEGAARRVGLVDDLGAVRPVRDVESTWQLAWTALEDGLSLAAQLDRLGLEPALPQDVQALADGDQLLPPLTHADPAHCVVSGTGLTHLGSASARDRMHDAVKNEGVGGHAVTDSMRMFVLGLEGGKSTAEAPGVAPEWFYKGDGSIVAAPGAPLPSPDFALDAGDEAEIVGMYLIGPDARPWRLGFAVGNELSDHVLERQNYLYLAHSKLRPCAVGPLLRTGTLPAELKGTSRIRRGAELLWEKEFVTGEAQMCHDIANLEYHHFKYARFLRPGDVHLHFFGAAVLSFADGIQARPGDEFEVEIAGFGPPLRNRLSIEPSPCRIHGTGVL